MLTLCEAINRLRVYNMGIRRFGSDWQVFFHEDKKRDETNTYVSDTLEDCVLQGGVMRLRRNAAI